MPTIRRGKTGIVVYGMYQYYRELLEMKGHQDKRSEFNVGFQAYCTVIRLFNKKWKDAMIYDSWVFKFPYRLGTLYIRKKKIRIRLDKNGELYKSKLKPDWPRTKKLWTEMHPGLTKEELKAIPHKNIVYVTNDHTQGYRFWIHWQKKYCNIPGHGPYEFVFARANKRELAHVLKTNSNINFYE